ncbi:GntR family transcriptional regulator [Emcibacter sp.]|uniref:GntR family transcriptional regulator n=1 Tax=Emcibacter sp. TaxID=1979954 RepID=UPI002AA871C7|nr:GntR family transcriptional regulator [Emcibacter sp.]
MTMSKSAEKAYAVIRNAVLDGHFAPGDHLREERLVELCGVSRTPVREAIKRLAAENYVVMKPHLGAHVANWSPQEIEDIFRLRAVTEGMAARRAAELITPEQLDILKEQHKIIEDMLAEDAEYSMEKFLKANKVFHNTILQATQSEILKQAVQRLVSPPIVTQTAINFTRNDLKRSNAHHLELIEALEARNGDWSDATMQTHILAAHQRFSATLNG